MSLWRGTLIFCRCCTLMSSWCVVLTRFLFHFEIRVNQLSLLNDIFNETLVVHQYFVVYRLVWLNDFTNIFASQLVFKDLFQDIVQLCHCDEAISLLIYLLDHPVHFMQFVISYEENNELSFINRGGELSCTD